jgi:hypothetical protein
MKGKRRKKTTKVKHLIKIIISKFSIFVGKRKGQKN